MQQIQQHRCLLSSLHNRQELLLLDVGRFLRTSDLFGRFDTFLRYEGQPSLAIAIIMFWEGVRPV